jgi:hypothetical protein
MTDEANTPTAEHTALPKVPLVYRSRAHDDWGCIRDASGVPVLRAGVFDRESVLNQHRRDGTDPVEGFCKTVIAAVNERPMLLSRIRELEEALADARNKALEEAAEKVDRMQYHWRNPATDFSEGAYHHLGNAARAIRSYLQAAGLPAPVPEWHSMEEIPVTPLGTVRNFAVAFRSKERGSVWVEEAHFLNAFPLTPRDDNADEIEGADDDGNVPFTGWHERFGDEDEPFYQGIQMDNPYTEVLGWAEMPKHPLAASPRATGETGNG